MAPEVPPATPATNDFVCWLWAAFPPREDRMNISRIARALGVSRSTVRRWISSDDPKLSRADLTQLHQRAVLRGRGDYLWPDLDPVSRRRADLVYETAVRARELIGNEPERIAPEWHKNGTLESHQVHLVWFPHAHAYGVASTRHEKSLAKIARRGEILQTVTVPDKFSAVALKYEVLRAVDEHRCISPRSLVPTGRTETWRAAGGEPEVLMPFQAAVVRFAGLPSYAAVHLELKAALATGSWQGPTAGGRRTQLQTQPVADHVVLDAEGLWGVLSGAEGPAGLLVVSAPSETPSTWPTGPWGSRSATGRHRRRRDGPQLYLGSRRAATSASTSSGGRARGSGGTSLVELLEVARGVDGEDVAGSAMAGKQVPNGQVPNVVVLDVPHLDPQALRYWSWLIHPSTLLLARVEGPAARGRLRDRELAELALIAQRTRLNRGRRRREHAAITRGLNRYKAVRVG